MCWQCVELDSGISVEILFALIIYRGELDLNTVSLLFRLDWRTGS